MATFDVWDIVKIPFPTTNRPVQQVRPALVVGCYDDPGSPALLWVLMITSAGHRRWGGDVDISDLDAAGLRAPSMVRSAKIATIAAADAACIGRLSPPQRAQVEDHLAVRLPRVH